MEGDRLHALKCARITRAPRRDHPESAEAPSNGAGPAQEVEFLRLAGGGGELIRARIGGIVRVDERDAQMAEGGQLEGISGQEASRGEQ